LYRILFEVLPVRTTCAYCGVGCGIEATRTATRSADIKGDSLHPANHGKLCSKGTYLGETIGLEGRLLHPQINNRRASWNEALDLVADTFKSTIAEYGADSVALYVSGQLLTEDYYVANKLMKGFIGSGNIDTNSRLCMASAVAAHIRSFGEDIVPASYNDIDVADVIILVGSNTAWCHPVIYQRIMRAKEMRGTKIVVIDPRRTETAETADLHLPIKSGSDVALFQALLAHLYWHDALDDDFMRHVDVPSGFWKNLAALGDPIEYAARMCDVSLEDIAQFFEFFKCHSKTLTLFSQGVNQSSSGTDKASAILNLHLATGRIGKSGSTAFSITGQPNAMGGREVGGLATTLAAHMDFAAENVDRLQRFWAAPKVANKPGLKAVDMFAAVASGKIKALWIMATNPAVSMPDADTVRAALKLCPFVVVSDCIENTDTANFAHVLLPSSAWGEKDGTVTNSDRTISRQRRFLDPAGESKADWWQLSQVGQRMGWHDAFNYHTPADIFREHADLSGFENEGQRLFDISHKNDVSNAQYDAMEPFVWGRAQMFADGSFPTDNGNARLVSLIYIPPLSDISDAFPLVLNTGRLRDQWHTMTRTGLAPSLTRHRNEPVVEMNPVDAIEHHLSTGDLAHITTEFGSDIFRVFITDAQRPGDIFVPIHWNDAHSSSGKAGRLANSKTDPFSGQPAFKHTPARVSAFKAKYHGLLIGVDAPDLSSFSYWTRIRIINATAFEFASNADYETLKAQLLPTDSGVQLIEMQDQRRGGHRLLAMRGEICVALLYLSSNPVSVSRGWLFDQFSKASHAPLSMLAGRSASIENDPGEIICVCHNVGRNSLKKAIQLHNLDTLDAVGTATRAGSNCGSCRPILAKLIREARIL
jgi:assimilatory nitrate reductase catalytic subunit